jgi:octaprenyl-diphosphate synthase
MPGPERKAGGTPTPTEAVFAPVEGDLRRVRQRIRRLTVSRIEAIDECFSDLINRPGKMIRSGLMLLAAKAAGGRIGRRHIDYAAIIELIHTATLYHDDVIDQASVRRGGASANALWGNAAAVLMGDYLLSRAFSAGAQLNDPAANKLLTETAGRICQGELMQNLQSGNWNLNESEYFSIIDGKTAALFACAAHLGVFLSGGSEAAIRRCRRFGFELGRAFQITDDLLDLLGTEKDLGKTAGTDLVLNKATLPVIYWLEGLSERNRRHALRRLSTERDRQWVIAELRRAGSIEDTRRVLENAGRRAVRQLSALPESRAKSALLRLTFDVIERI